jgi:thiol:disulfide interchange protein DsbC
MLFMTNKIAVLVLLISICMANLCIAQGSESNIPAAQQNKITKIIESISLEMGKNLPIDQIKASPIPGLLQITSGLNVFYISEDGQYLALGEIIDTSKKQSTWNLTEQEVRQLRMQALATVKETDMVIFPSLGKKIGTVTVFTDLDYYY